MTCSHLGWQNARLYQGARFLGLMTPFLVAILLGVRCNSVALVLCFAIPAAYSLSVRPVRKWTDVMFFFLSTKFLPAAAGLVPLFVIALKIGALKPGV